MNNKEFSGVELYNNTPSNLKEEVLNWLDEKSDKEIEKVYKAQTNGLFTTVALTVFCMVVSLIGAIILYGIGTLSFLCEKRHGTCEDPGNYFYFVHFLFVMLLIISLRNIAFSYIFKRNNEVKWTKEKQEKYKQDFLSYKTYELKDSINYLEYKKQVLQEKQKAAKIAMAGANIYTVEEINAKFKQASKEYKTLISANNNSSLKLDTIQINQLKAKELKEKVLDKREVIISEYQKNNSITLNKYHEASNSLLALDTLIIEIKNKRIAYMESPSNVQADKLIEFFDGINLTATEENYPSLNNTYQSLNEAAKKFDDVATEANRIINLGKNISLEEITGSPVDKFLQENNSLS